MASSKKHKAYAANELDLYIEALAQQDEGRKKLFKELLVDSAYEREILCRAISLKGDFRYAMDFCELEDFSVDVNRALFYTMKQMVDSGACTLEDLSPLTVADYMGSRNLLNDVGGAANLEVILSGSPNPETSIPVVCNRLREKRAERKLIGRTSRVIERREKNVTDISRQDMMDELLAAFREHDELTKTLRSAEQTLGQMVQSTTGGLRGLLREPEGKRLPCPFPSLDRLLNGFMRGHLVVIGARPGMGKTSLAIQLATAASEVGVVIASYEMTVRELLERMACQVLESRRSEIDELLGYDEVPGQEELDRVLSGLHVWLDTDTLRKRTVSELRMIIQKRKAAGEKIGFVLCDYLQIMNAEIDQQNRRNSNRVQEIGQISGALKQLAKDEDLCVVAFSQLSRPYEKGRKDTEVPPRPTSTDLRDSGAIEQDADKIALIHRPEAYIKSENIPERMKGLAEILVPKNRYGSTGIVRLRWRGAFTMFSEMSEWELAAAANWDQPGIEDV